MNKLLYLNRFFASLADYGLMFLIPLVVFQTTGDAALAGLAFSIEYFVKVLFGPIAGLLVDRYPLIKLVSVTNVSRALAAFGCALLNVFEPSLVAIIGLAVINGAGFTGHFMAQETLLTELVCKRGFAKTQANVQQFEQLALVSAPILFAALMTIMQPTGLFALAGGLFLCAQGFLVLGAGTKVFQSPPDAQSSLRQQLKDNLRVGQHYLLASKPLQKIVASTFLINMIYGTLLAIGAVAVTGLFERSPAEFATLQTSGAIGAIAVLAIVSRFSDRVTPTQLGFVAFCMMSVGGFIAGVSSHYFAFLVGAVFILSFDGVFSVYIRTRRMEIIHRKDFGKAIGLLMIVNNLSKPMSGILVFLLSPWFSVTQILLIATVVTVAGTLGFRLFSIQNEQVSLR